MKLSLWFTLLIIAFIVLIQDEAEAGILRRTRRLRRIGISSRNGRIRSRNPRLLSHRRRWPHFLAPPRKYTNGRSLRRMKTSHSERDERFHHRPVHQLRLPLMMAQAQPLHAYQAQASTQLNAWRPLDFGNPIDRDPTFDYAPPSLERVRFSERPGGEPRKRKQQPPHLPPKMMNRETNKPRPLFKPPRRPSIWKMLATKQRRRPYPMMNKRPMAPFMRFPENAGNNAPFKDEAEIFPRMPNIVYFQHADVLKAQQQGLLPLQTKNKDNNKNNGNPNKPPFLVPNGAKPGRVTNVPLYSHENVSPSQFNPIRPLRHSSTTPISAPIPRKPDDILYRPQDFMNPTRKPTVLQPVFSTTKIPSTVPSTRNSVLKPIDPTESLIQIINDPPKPIQNSVNILNSVNSVFGHQPVFTPFFEHHHHHRHPLPPHPPPPPHHVFLGQPQHIPQEEANKNLYHFGEEPVPVPSGVTPSYNNDNDEATTISVSTSVSTSTSVLVRSPEVSSTTTTERPETTTTTTTTTTEVPTTPVSLYQRLPEMPTYKKRQPIYPKRYSSSLKSSSERNSGVNSNPHAANHRDSNGSGEGLVITMARSKVKEYKPQFLANYSQLLTFDKVAEAEEPGESVESVTALPSLTVTSAPVLSSTSSPSPSYSSNNNNKSKDAPSSSQNSSSSNSYNVKSPLQDFDPMQLLHNWFQNT